MSRQAVALDEVAVIQRTGIDPASLGQETPYVGLEHIESGGRLLEVTPVANGELKSTKFAFGPDHILYGKLRPYLAKIALPEFAGICSTDILPILPGPRIDRNYLCQFLRQPSMVDYAASRAEGANLPRLSPKALAKFEIPLPPLNEQKRIAAILDKADQLRQKRRQAVALLDSLTQSIFLEMFGEEGQSAVSLKASGFANEHQHRRYLLTDVARLATGHTPDRKISEYWGGRIPWITLGDIRAVHGRTIHSTREYVTKRGIDNSSAVVLPSGTVCLSRTASVGFATITEGEMATSQDFVNWVCGSKLLPEYLLASLSASKRGLVALATGSTHRTIYLPTVERFTILLPDIEIQRYMVERRRKIINLMEKNEMSLPHLESLFSSLQHRAFSGQL